MTEFLHRYYETVYARGIDDYGDILPGPGTVGVHMSSYKIIKRTNKGAWIDVYGEKKFVLLTARKKFACETPKEALESFIRRKERQISILGHKVYYARKAIEKAKEIKEKTSEGTDLCRPIGLWQEYVCREFGKDYSGMDRSEPG